jgi:hypothetical protein
MLADATGAIEAAVFPQAFDRLTAPPMRNRRCAKGPFWWLTGG